MLIGLQALIKKNTYKHTHGRNDIPTHKHTIPQTSCQIRQIITEVTLFSHKLLLK